MSTAFSLPAVNFLMPSMCFLYVEVSEVFDSEAGIFHDLAEQAASEIALAVDRNSVTDRFFTFVLENRGSRTQGKEALK